MTKDKPKKTPDKSKKKEKPNKRKPSKKAPSTVYRSVKSNKTSIELDEIRRRRDDRVKAVVRASNILRDMGYTNERGNSLVIVPRLKLMLAFDSVDMDDSLQKEVGLSGFKLVHVMPVVFKVKKVLHTFLADVVYVYKSEEPKPKKLRRLKKSSRSAEIGLT